MASTYQTNRGGAGGAGGSSEPYVQGVVIGDWTNNATPGEFADAKIIFQSFEGQAPQPYNEQLIINGDIYDVPIDYSAPDFLTGIPENTSVNISGLASLINASGTFPSGVEATVVGIDLVLTAVNDGVIGNNITVSLSGFEEFPSPYIFTPSDSGVFQNMVVYSPGLTYPVFNLDGGVDGIVDPDYTITINAATHDKGTEPTATLYEENGGIFEEVEAYVAIDATGNITIKVPVSPDGRFTGKIVVN